MSVPTRLLASAALLLFALAPLRARADAPRECATDADCAPKCAAVVSGLNAPSGQQITFSGHECRSIGKAVGPGEPPPGPPTTGCACLTDASAFIFLAPGFGKAGCLRNGRNHACLYTEAEFPGCDLAAAGTSCAAVCADLKTRMQRDQDAPAGATLHGAYCAGVCGCVTKIGGGCYLEPAHEKHDCALTAAQIWDKTHPTTPGPGTSGPGGPATADAGPDASASPGTASSSSGCATSPSEPASGVSVLALAGIAALAGRRRRARTCKRAAGERHERRGDHE